MRRHRPRRRPLAFAPTADAQVQEASASTNYGTSTALRVDAGTDPDVESYLRFAVSGVSGSVQSATLRLWVTDSTANGPAVYTTANTWSETAITWANRTARVGSGVDDKGSVPSGAWVDFNVTSLVSGNGGYNFVLAGASTDGIDFSSREASTNKPQLVIATAVSGDNQNPTDPTGLSATPTSGTRVDLSWTASTDNNSVTNYEIYRDNVLLTTVGAVTSYRGYHRRQRHDLCLQLKAVDGAGNHSGFSNTASVTTPDTAAPSDPTSLNATASSATRIDLTWTASTDNVGVTNYEIYRDDVLLTTVGAVTSYADTTVSPSTTYAYKLKAVDAAGNHSGFGNTSSANTPATPDGDPPTDVTDLAATAAGATRIDLSWTASTDNIAVTHYEIYRGSTLVATIGNVTTYADLNLDPSTSYSYRVKALDAVPNSSGFSNTATATHPG